ncbi:hypothetical protein [Stackebrandtia soli]|uniref:hypothetical protein n=1 Tax=Stackebrandtia soli TaxID=1892856 RepID=UPI0039ED3586
MRHIASLFAGLIIAPLAWLLVGAGQIGLNPSLYEATAGTPNRYIAMAMLAGAGILLGSLAVTRMSPAGPVTAGAILLIAFFLFRSDILAFNVPGSLAAAKIPAGSAIAAGQQGLVLAMATLLLLTAVVPSRWRGKRTDDDRDLDTASLAAPGSTSSTTTSNAVDPFAGISTRSESGSTVPDDRQVDPFATAERSPYADESYGPDERGYGQTREEPSTQPQPYAGQYGDQGQGQGQYGDRGSYADQGYGNQQPYR